MQSFTARPGPPSALSTSPTLKICHPPPPYGIPLICSRDSLTFWPPRQRIPPRAPLRVRRPIVHPPLPSLFPALLSPPSPCPPQRLPPLSSSPCPPPFRFLVYLVSRTLRSVGSGLVVGSHMRRIIRKSGCWVLEIMFVSISPAWAKGFLQAQ